MFVSSSTNFSFLNQTPLENSILDLFIEDDELCQILMSNASPQTLTNPTSLSDETSSKATTMASILEKKSKKQQNTRKRAGKKDRHSKICTAQGPRDRRMRLSLQIARKFFDLQDMLGFDKPSKTIEWLFSKSKSAIKELKESFPQVKLSCLNDGGMSVELDEEEDPLKNMMTASSTERKSRKIRTVPRESRQKARERARERTREKHMIRDLEKPDDPRSNLGKEEYLFKIEEIMKSEVKESAELEEPPMEDASSSSSLNFIYSETIGFTRNSNSHEDFLGFVMNWDGTSTIL